MVLLYVSALPLHQLTVVACDQWRGKLDSTHERESCALDKVLNE